MNDRDFELAGKKYKLHKLDAFKQFHVVRRLSPILGDLIAVAPRLAKVSPNQMGDEQLALLSPILKGISALSDADSNFVLNTLLSSIEMQQTAQGGWARVSTDSGLMFQDLELPILLQLAGRAFQYNMAGFFILLPQASPGRG
jgi:hypothetical protein